MIGAIQVVQPAKSGNSLRVQISGQWYSAKFDSGLSAADVGKNGTFILGDTPFPPGSTNYWINDYTFEGATSPATQAMDAAMANRTTAPQYEPPTGHPAAPQQASGYDINPPKSVNKDAKIGALALVKSFQPSPDANLSDVEQIWDAYTWFYHKLNNWNPQDDPPYQ